MSAHPPSLDVLLEHGPLVRRLARVLLADANDADDLAQETWLAAVRRPPAVVDTPRGWLSRVTRNLAISGYRRRRAREHHEARAAPERHTWQPDEIAVREETRRIVLEALLGLDEPYRATLLLRFYEDLPPRVVARRMGVPVETVRTRVKRGLARLRVALDAGSEEERSDRWRALAVWAGPTGAATATLWTAAAGAAILVLLGGVATSLLRREAATVSTAGVPRSASEATQPARLQGQGGPERPDGPRASGDHAEGSDASTSAADATAPVLVQFDVRSEDGASIENAIVFAVPRARPDLGLLPGLLRAKTDEHGVAELELQRPDAWIVRTLAHGYAVAEVEGATLAPGEALQVRLKRLPTTRIALRRIDGAPTSEPTHLWLVSQVDRATKHVGGLGDYVLRPDLTQAIEVPPDGDVEVGFSVPMPAVLMLHPGYPSNGALLPPQTLVREGVDRIDLQLVKPCRIGLRLCEGEGCDVPRFSALPSYELISERTGLARRIRFTLRGSVDTSKAYELVSWTSLGPDRYRLTVRVPGFDPWTSESLDLSEPGMHVDLVARLKATPSTAAALTLRFPEAALSKQFLPIGVSVRQSGDPAARWSSLGSPGLQRSGQDATDWEVAGLEAGAWDLLVWVWNGEAWRVACLEGVTTTRGHVQTVIAETQPGLFVDLAPHAATHERFERVVLTSPGLGVLPLRSFPRGRFSGRVDDFLWAAPHPRTHLGPYPGSRVEVEAVTWDGTVHRHEVPASGH